MRQLLRLLLLLLCFGHLTHAAKSGGQLGMKGEAAIRDARETRNSSETRHPARVTVNSYG